MAQITFPSHWHYHSHLLADLLQATVSPAYHPQKSCSRIQTSGLAWVSHQDSDVINWKKCQQNQRMSIFYNGPGYGNLSVCSLPSRKQCTCFQIEVQVAQVFQSSMWRRRLPLPTQEDSAGCEKLPSPVWFPPDSSWLLRQELVMYLPAHQVQITGTKHIHQSQFLRIRKTRFYSAWQFSLQLQNSVLTSRESGWLQSWLCFTGYFGSGCDEPKQTKRPVLPTCAYGGQVKSQTFSGQRGSPWP